MDRIGTSGEQRCGENNVSDVKSPELTFTGTVRRAGIELVASFAK
jgi:hypothetical protein